MIVPFVVLFMWRPFFFGRVASASHISAGSVSSPRSNANRVTIAL
jgi:hypothetical protein